MLPTLILSSFVGVTLPEEVVDRLVSTRTVVVQRQVKLEVVIFSGDPLGSKEAGTLDELSRPTLMLTHKQTGFFQVGEATGQGITFRATPQLRLDGKIGLNCETQLSRSYTTQITTAQGAYPATATDTQTAKAAVVVAPGKSHQVRLSAKSATEQTWIEVTATIVEAPIQATAAEPNRATKAITSTAPVMPAMLPVLPAAVPPSALLPTRPKSK